MAIIKDMNINLKELILLREMPKTGVTLDPKYKIDMENNLKFKMSTIDVFDRIDENPMGDGYNVLFGYQNDILDRWACIIKRIDQDNIKLCVGSSFKLNNHIKGITSYQVMLTYKFETLPDKASAKLYIYLVKKWNCAILSGERATDDGVNIWLGILTNPKLEQLGIKTFVWDEDNQREIINYGKIEDLFGKDNKFENILIGIKPI